MTELRILMFKEDLRRTKNSLLIITEVREFIDDCIIQREGRVALKMSYYCIQR
jgi:hypothetical protein